MTLPFRCRSARSLWLSPRERGRAVLALMALTLVTPGLATGCRASAPDIVGASVDPIPLRWPVPLPPALRAEAPVLWVALAAQLGPAPGRGRAGQGAALPGPLLLEAGSAPLRLRDARGQVVAASRLVIGWRLERLVRPQRWRRRVAGPFPSHESAEQVARLWGAPGLEIAHPNEWEVWAPVDQPVPPTLVTRLEQGMVLERWQPQLRGPGRVRDLVGPLEIEAPGGLRWHGGLYGGPFRLQGDALGRWTLVEQVPLERYLEGVLPHEIGAGAPAAALAAQAVLARTWALRNRGRFQVDGYHLCADTQCQVYGDPRQAGSRVREAIRLTHGQVLAWNSRPVHAVYHASNGGMAAGFEEAWTGEPQPYLKAAADGPEPFSGRFAAPLEPTARLRALLRQGGAAYGSDHPRFRWQRRLQAQQLQVLERGPSGRVLTLAVDQPGGQRLILRRDAIRRHFRQLPSTLFELFPEGGGRWRLEGGGFGHGVGLSQAGAIDLARRGWGVERILTHYYPGARLQSLESLAGAP